MKFKLACASVLVLSGCAVSKDAMDALQLMQIEANSADAPLSYKSISGSGNDVTLSGVELRTPRSAAIMFDGGALPEPAGAPPSGPSALQETPAAGAVTLEAILHAETMTFKGLTMKDGKPLARDIVFLKVTPVVEEGDDTQITLGQIGIVGMNETTGAYMASLFRKGGPGAPPAFEQWAFDKASLGGLTVTTGIPQESGDPGKINVQLGELSFSGLKDKYLASARLAGLKGDVNFTMMVPITGTFDLGTLDLGGIKAGQVSDIFAAGMKSALNPFEQIDYASLYKDMTSPLDGGIDRMDWTGMKVNVSGLKLDTSAFHAAITRDAAGVAIATHTPRATMTFKTDSSNGTLGALGYMMLAMAGYDSDTIEMHVEGDFAFDPATDITRWQNLDVGVTDAFEIKVSGGVKGLKQAYPSLMAGFDAIERMSRSRALENMFSGDDDEDSDDEDSDDEDSADEDADAPSDEHFSHDPDADDDEASDDDADDDSGDDDSGSDFDAATMMPILMGLLPLQLTDLDLTITDQKVVSLIVDQQATKAGLTGAELRADMAAMVAGGSGALTDAGVDPAIASELTTAVSGFLAGPGTLHIQLKPKTPFGAMTAMLQPITKESLGFSASFTPIAVPPAPTN